MGTAPERERVRSTVTEPTGTPAHTPSGEQSLGFQNGSIPRKSRERDVLRRVFNGLTASAAGPDDAMQCDAISYLVGTGNYAVVRCAFHHEETAGTSYRLRPP